MNKINTIFSLFPMLLTIIIGVAHTEAATLIADLRGDYQTTTIGQPTTNVTAYGIPATGSGHWNFYKSTTQNPLAGTLTLLNYGTEIGASDGDGYGGGETILSDPTFNDMPAFATNAMYGTTDPADDELGLHPGDITTYAVAAWTIGNGEMGSISITGKIHKIGLGGDSVDFSVWTHSSDSATAKQIGATKSISTTSGQIINTPTTATVGDTIYFVCGNGPTNAADSDGSALKVHIYHLDTNNLARGGTAIMGLNANDDGSRGTDYTHSGTTNNINDGNLGTCVDSWNLDGSPDGYDWVGISWPTPQNIGSIRLHHCTFVNGGWYSTNNNDDDSGLVSPNVQITTDGGTTWSNLPSARSDYVSVLSGNVPSSANTLQPPITFTFANAGNIDGIRLFGNGGGSGSSGFIGIYELEAFAPPPQGMVFVIK